MSTSHDLPDQETLLRCMAVLQDAIVEARFRAYSTDPQTAELLDAIHNLPNLLMRWPEAKPEYIKADLERYEKTYLSGEPRYTRTLASGVGPTWQPPR